MGYKEDIRIDIHVLDAEWIKQASLYQYYAKQEAMALYKRDQLADKLALTQAQLDGDIRLDLKKHGFESKPTEAAILNSIKQNPFYIKANSLLMKASCKAKIIGGAVRAFDHKKKALEKLTDLYLSGYWAAPKIRSEAQEVYGEQAQEALSKDLQKDERILRLQAAQKEKTEKKKTDVKEASKGPATAREKKTGKKTGGKTKSESKPVGKTEEQIRPKLKGAGKKKK
jgi:hypothetical protein